MRERSHSFQNIGAFRFWLFNISGDDHPEALLGIYAGDDLFPTLRVQPMLGRGFERLGDSAGRAPEVIISHRLWARHFASNPGILGENILLNQAPVTVIGVLPENFRFPPLVPGNVTLDSREPDIYMPLGTEIDSHDNRGNDNYFALGRLNTNVTLSVVQTEVADISRQLAGEYPEHDARLLLQVSSLQSVVVGDSTRSLFLLLGAVGFVLLIACANVANLLLARAASRRREMALRTALGATRGRLAGQMLTESIVLALIGGLLGILAARWGVHLIQVAAPDNIPRLEEVTVNAGVLGFTFVISILTGVIFGVVPALQALRTAPGEALKESGRLSAGLHRSRLRNALITAEIALSLVLLAGAGLLLRSFRSVAGVETGFDGTNVITMVTLLPPTRYPDADGQAVYARRAVAAISRLPGVVHAGVINTLPLSNLGSSTTMEIVGRPAPRVADRPTVNNRIIEGSYYAALRIPVVAGREFNPGDSAGAPRVAIINEALAEKFFPGENPIGRKILLFEGSPLEKTIVGVVGDTRGESLETPAVPEASYPMSQGESPLVTIVARTAGDPHALLPSMRRELLAIDPDLSFFMVRTMDELLSGTLAQRRFNLWLLGGFSLAALLLASIGLYGVIAYSVAQRTRELGVRAALGADRGAILRMLLSEGMKITGTGAALGLVGALSLGRLLGNQLYGVGPFDPLAFAGVLLVLFTVAAVAIYVPARRATRVAPTVAMQSE